MTLGLQSDYANRVRHYPNALIIPSHVSKEEDMDFDETSLEEKEEEEYIRPRRSAALAAAAAAAAAAASTSSSSLSSSLASTSSTSSLTSTLSTDQPPFQVTSLPTNTIKKWITRTNYLYYHMVPTSFKQLSSRIKEYLVPIKLDLDLDGFKLRDMFLWNLNEPLFTPEKFAEIMVHDLELPNKFIPLIALNIRLQLEEANELGNGQSVLAEWDSDEAIVIELEFLAGRILLRDRFEFDPSQSNPTTPEQFAKLTCAELGLPSELAPLYATSLREAILRHLKTKPSKSLKRDPATGLFQMGRDSEDWSPIVETLEEALLEKHLDKDKREVRRHRRLQRSSLVSKVQLNEVMVSLQTIQSIETQPSGEYPLVHQVWKQLIKKEWLCEQCYKHKIDIFDYFAKVVQPIHFGMQHPFLNWQKKLEVCKLICDDCKLKSATVG